MTDLDMGRPETKATHQGGGWKVTRRGGEGQIGLRDRTKAGMGRMGGGGSEGMEASALDWQLWSPQSLSDVSGGTAGARDIAAKERVHPRLLFP